NADQPAAALLASQAAGSTVPPGNGNPFPATYNGWQLLTAKVTSSPYYATDDTCTAQCWYDEDVYTPAGMPDTVYVIGSYNYNELPCNTKGVGCGNGRSNGRAGIYSTTGGDPDASAPDTAVNRTFTDLIYDMQDEPASWCGLGPAGEAAFGGVSADFACLWAPNNIHPDQHAIVVNPSNPTQIFEGLGRRRDPHRRHVRRPVGQVQLGRAAAARGGESRELQANAVAGAEPDHARRSEPQHAAVHQRRHQPV